MPPASLEQSLALAFPKALADRLHPFTPAAPPTLTNRTASRSTCPAVNPQVDVPSVLAYLQPPVRHTRIGQCVGQGKQIIHTEQARVPGGVAFIGHPAGEQAAHRVEAAESMGDEAHFVFIKTNFV